MGLSTGAWGDATIRGRPPSPSRLCSLPLGVKHLVVGSLMRHPAQLSTPRSFPAQTSPTFPNLPHFTAFLHE